MANLYELMSEYDALQAALEDDELTDEVLDKLLEQIEEAQGTLRSKVDNICRLLSNVGGDVEKFRSEERRLGKRRKAMENKANRICAWLKASMDLIDIEKVKTDIFEVSIVEQGHRIIVVDESKLPEEFMRVKRSPDMTRLNKAYKEDGEIPPGCDVVLQKAMRIR
jgi:hypothetical protein